MNRPAKETGCDEFSRSEGRPPRWLRALHGLFFLSLAFGAVWGFLSLFAPEPYEPPLVAVSGYDPAEALQAVAVEKIEARLTEITALGNRFLGKPGFYAAESLIRDAYRKAGLSILEQELRTVAPQTEIAAAFDTEQNRVDFEVYPFMPNGYQPVCTPDGGATGRLVVVDDAMLSTRASFEGCMALIDASRGAPEGYEYDYVKYAQLGFAGVIVSHPEGLDNVDWSAVKGMCTESPVNFLRVAADPGVFQYVGQPLTFKVRVRYRDVPNRTLVGVWRGKQPKREALVIPCSYDALSVLPDRSPGVIQAGQLATHLQLLEGLSAYRDHVRRDIFFVAFGGRSMAHDPQDRLVAALGSAADRESRHQSLIADRRQHRARLRQLEACLPVLDVDSARAAERGLASLNDGAAALFRDQLRYVLNARLLAFSERVLKARIAFEVEGGHDLDSMQYRRYRSEKRAYDAVFSCAGFDWPALLEKQAALIQSMDLPSMLAARFSALVRYHQRERHGIEQSLALNAAFSDYQRIVVLGAELTPARDAAGANEALTLTMGRKTAHDKGLQPARGLLQAAIQETALEDRVSLHAPAVKNYGWRMHSLLGGQEVEAAYWSFAGYPAYSVVNRDRTYSEFSAPVDRPWMRNLESLASSIKAYAAAILSAAYGNGRFEPLPFSPARIQNLSGHVYVSNVGRSLIPNYPLRDALVSGAGSAGLNRLSTGYAGKPLLMTDPYGRYQRRYCLSSFITDLYDYSPVAVGYDTSGQICFVKDQGAKSQRIYSSMGLGPDALARDVNIICYRASPVTLLDLINPQRMRRFAGAQFIRVKGMSEFEHFYYPSVQEELLTAFIPPDERFFVELKAGAPDNKRVQVTRGFLLGEPLAGQPDGPGALGGRGYLAAETPLIRNVAAETAQSMVRVNRGRLNLQNRYGMSDARMRELQARAEKKWAAARQSGQSRKADLLQARDAVTYSMLNHPVLRENIFEAVAGVLWYLGLMVPFTFFFEKLVFGFSDIRKQLAAHGVIFLSVFVLLKALHPAFELIRSSLMILLGFIILLISLGILGMFGSKFRENLEGLKQQRGRVTAAEVNRVGALVTAFMLGLNNMHRRRLRTLLTCGTLVLITFVMICFTSVKRDIVEQSRAIGRAPFSGFVVKNPEFAPVDPPERFALQMKYGDRFAVVARSVLMGVEDRETRERVHPELVLRRQGARSACRVHAKSVLALSASEPLVPFMGLRGRWFTKADETAAAHPVILPETMARSLGLPVSRIVSGETVRVDINGVRHPVCGVFDPVAFNHLRDLDGQSLLPFDIEALTALRRIDGKLLAADDAPRLSAEHVILSPRPLDIPIPHSERRILSVAVVFPRMLSPGQGRAAIQEYMEQSGRSTFFGLDGIAFLGRRARVSTFVGLVDMLIPLIIAAITVLNTIRGSVYERKEEIFVYNAVGIAPKQIFFMFFAEAFVYAVVGSVLGFILSQATGRVLMALGLTGGLNMTFTSLGTIYVSLTIAASVFVSTLFPARTAMRIASPSDDPGWQLPAPEGERLHVRLPFTFDARDRVAVLAFFRRFFVDHGEGSSGAYFACEPLIGIAAEGDPLNDGGCIPQIAAKIWLKPFDLGVSQQLTVALPRDAETGEFVADIAIVRESGTMANWLRLNRAFVVLLRKQFLHWRAVAPEARGSLFEEASASLRAFLEDRP